jgi:predicted rRNA methylase YqxC with S4 and FtsJ domains
MNTLLLTFNKEEKVSCEFLKSENSRKSVDITGHAQTSFIDTKSIVLPKHKIAQNGNHNLFVVKNQFMLNMAKITAKDNSISALYLRDEKNNHMFMTENNVCVEYKN